jgi:hypothetical protein
MKLATRALVALPAVAGSALVAAPAFAQNASDPANFDQTKIVDAVNTGLANGISVLLAIAPIVIAFAVVWMIIKKGRGMAGS